MKADRADLFNIEHGLAKPKGVSTSSVARQDSTPLHTPTPWEVKELMGQKFIAAKPYKGHPYFNRTRTIEIMSDENYPTKSGDAELIVAAVNNFSELVENLHECKSWTYCDCGHPACKRCRATKDAEAVLARIEQGSGAKIN